MSIQMWIIWCWCRFIMHSCGVFKKNTHLSSDWQWYYNRHRIVLWLIFRSIYCKFQKLSTSIACTKCWFRIRKTCHRHLMTVDLLTVKIVVVHHICSAAISWQFKNCVLLIPAEYYTTPLFINVERILCMQMQFSCILTGLWSITLTALGRR